MRTTLTLDPNVARRIERLRYARSLTLRDIVNQALREGLPRLEAPHRPRKQHATKAVSLGGCRIGNVDDVVEVLAVADRRGRRTPPIRVDANVLVYARVSDFDQHTVVRAWFEERPNGRLRVGLPWSSVQAFLRLVTSPRIFARPEPVRALRPAGRTCARTHPVEAQRLASRRRRGNTQPVLACELEAAQQCHCDSGCDFALHPDLIRLSRRIAK